MSESELFRVCSELLSALNQPATAPNQVGAIPDVPVLSNATPNLEVVQPIDAPNETEALPEFSDEELLTAVDQLLAILNGPQPVLMRPEPSAIADNGEPPSKFRLVETGNLVLKLSFLCKIRIILSNLAVFPWSVVKLCSLFYFKQV